MTSLFCLACGVVDLNVNQINDLPHEYKEKDRYRSVKISQGL